MTSFSSSCALDLLRPFSSVHCSHAVSKLSTGFLRIRSNLMTVSSSFWPPVLNARTSLPALWQPVYLCARTFPTLLHMDSDSISFRQRVSRVREAWLGSCRLCSWTRPCGPMVAVYRAVLRMSGEWIVGDRPRLVCSLLLFSSCPSTRQPCCHTRCEIP